MAVVRLQNLSKTYPATGKTAEFAAVRGIDLEIRDGEFMVLVGPSGCGKSTTLRLIAGLEEATSGAIEIDGRVVNDLRPNERDIAMVFQNYALYPHMSVFENMAFGLRLRKLPRAEIEQRVREAAELLEIGALLERFPKALSGGQRQRVAVGRAIVRQPKVFLFDEPLSNLDAKMRVSMRTELMKLHHRLGATMIYVTHDQVEAMTMGDRICVMRDGEIQQVAEPLALYEAPENTYVASFIGAPPMNLLRGRIEREGDWFEFVEEAASSPARIRLTDRVAEIAASHGGSEVILGIRPERISIAQPGAGMLRATVELSEPLGAETFLHVTTGAHPLIARVAPTERHLPGAAVELRLDLEHARLFSVETGRLLR